ncbi:MAG: thymidine phosphorylase [Mollicutes bacterium]|nr:thymidine phosphorylase [Mollicutes bacterium]MDY5875633.1 thymidine phosphorylase [Bacilli bacterium]
MILDIINKKRLGKELSYEELDFFFNGYLDGKVADYQMSSLLMAICINGMTDEEIYALTKIFIDSGDVLDFSDIPGIKVDKHSTGGIGDKTTLVIAPIAAACGVPIIKMSGRGLGYTGGTIDKLESIPGYRIDLTDEEIIKQVHEIGIVVTGQTGDLVPMDKVIYALRDVTSTVSSIPLIASSIMSKKIASGADKIIIDIKVGNGALLQTKEDAKKLSSLMKKIGSFYNREVHTIISDMNAPLGYAVGNSLEVLEAIDVLKGKEKDNHFVDLCIELASDMVSMGKNISIEEARDLVLDAIDSKKAYKKFLELVEYQHGDIKGIKVSENTYKIKAEKSGIIKKIDALEVGKLSLNLGSGKVSIKDKIDYTVGVKLNFEVGDVVDKGDVLATIYYNKKNPEVLVDKIFKID